MTTSTANRHRRGLRLGGTMAAVVVGAYAVVYLLWALYLFLLADEGSLPPRWRVPDVPAGAQIVSETKLCGSGGCWRQLVVRPDVAQSPDELAIEMGVDKTERESWRLYDPHSVEIGSTVVGEELTIYVRY